MHDVCGECHQAIETYLVCNEERWRHVYPPEHIPYPLKPKPAAEWSPNGIARLAAAAMANDQDEQRDLAIAAELAELRKEVADLHEERDRLCRALHPLTREKCARHEYDCCGAWHITTYHDGVQRRWRLGLPNHELDEQGVCRKCSRQIKFRMVSIC